MKKLRSHQLAISKMLCKASGQVLLPGDVKFLRQDHVRATKVFGMTSRITDCDVEFEITNQHYHSRCLGKSTLALLDHIELTDKVMRVARDVQPMNDDLQPLFPEERQKFGVRVSYDNLCFPMSPARRGYMQHHADALTYSLKACAEKIGKGYWGD